MDMEKTEILSGFERLRRCDTPSVTNAVATYPGDPNCLSLYDAWSDAWYTDQSIRCMYPHLAPRIGVAVTAVYGLPGVGGEDIPFAELLRTVAAVQLPVVVAIHQAVPEDIRRKYGLLGGNMVTAMRACGAVGVVCDGPSRDWDEIEPLEFQMLLTGLTPGHGDFALKAVNTEITVGGMCVVPGEIIHMDCNGAVKFPMDKLPEVCENTEKILTAEAKRQTIMRSAPDAETVINALAGLYD